jgi:hypothetical protein
MTALMGIIDLFLGSNSPGICPVPDYGWLSWTMGDLRGALRAALSIDHRLRDSLKAVQELVPTAKIRWGVWLNQYVLPFTDGGAPAIAAGTAQTIFDFEPDNLLLMGEPIFRANRRWENFVCVPRRLLDGTSDWGFRWLDRKRPSAIDHAAVAPTGSFVGRERELAFLDRCWQSRRGAPSRVAIVAAAGAGKTRLIKEWLRRSSKRRVRWISFSLFGGDQSNIVEQLAELPATLDRDVLLQAAIAAGKAADVLVVDDLHFADEQSVAFVRELLNAASQHQLILLVSRPSGRAYLEALGPASWLWLEPLASDNLHELVEQLAVGEEFAASAVKFSQGNPLFVEQFAAWAAEVGCAGAEEAPTTLHQIIAARIAHLTEVRLQCIRQQLAWRGSWERAEVHTELDRLEAEIGRWLDRLETGDYADRIEVARHLVALDRADFEIFLVGALAGKARVRSSRLREAIERLLLGSGEEILADLRKRSGAAAGVESENIVREARRAGDVAYAEFAWGLAAEFYALTLEHSRPYDLEEVRSRICECRRRARPILENEQIAAEFDRDVDLETRPMIDARRLPEVWLQLARHHHSPDYFQRTADAAEAINHRGLAAWASARAKEFDRDVNR